jgi:hypothetical protein
VNYGAPAYYPHLFGFNGSALRVRGTVAFYPRLYLLPRGFRQNVAINGKVSGQLAESYGFVGKVIIVL